MNFFALICLLLAHYLIGRGTLKVFAIQMEAVPLFCLSMMTGVVVMSFVPCIVQLLNIPITGSSIAILISVFAAIACLPLFYKFKKPAFTKIRLPAVYEWPFLLMILVLLAASAWRCFYFPPIPRDLITGPELIAEFTVREHSMINSVFSVDLHTTNNYFKSPFITSLQIIYKLFVCPFGQVWLTILSVCFTALLYAIARRLVHPVLAGALVLLFLSIPELFGYTFLVLYDYSNMIFYFLGFYFLVRFCNSGRMNELVFSAFLFGLATYIRTETLLLTGMLLPVLFIYFRRVKPAFKKQLVTAGIFLLLPAAFYILCIYVFIRNFIPIPLDVSAQINKAAGDFSPFFSRLWEEQNSLIFSAKGVQFYGYFVFLFYLVFLIDLVLIRKFSRDAKIYLYGIIVVFIGLAFIGYLLPLADLWNTTKRGLFKAFPLMLLYMLNSGSVKYLADLLSKLEWNETNKADLPR